MSTPLLQFTNQISDKLGARTISLDNMSLKDLKDYSFGLARYRPNQTEQRKVVQEQIDRKDRVKKFTPSEKPITRKVDQQISGQQLQSPSMASIVIRGIYALTQILSIVEQTWLKMLLTIADVGVIVISLIAAAGYIWSLRDIRKFESTFED